jgi:hypothetical protein
MRASIPGLLSAVMLLGAGLWSDGASAQVSPDGPEFQVNAYTTSSQRFGRLALDGLGNFVVVWDSVGSYGSDQSIYSIQARRYDASGTPVGNQFQVNTLTTDFQQRPGVASTSDGRFVVVWDSDVSSGSDTSNRSVQARLYDSSGAPLGPEFQVNTYTTLSQGRPAVAEVGPEGFVVAWESFGSFGTDTNGYSIQARRFDADGNPLGDQFQVNTYTTGFQSHPTLAGDPLGGFVVIWQSDGSSGSDSSGSSVQAQRFDPSGAPIGGEIQVNTYTTDDQGYPQVTMDAQGTFLVVWDSYGSSGSDDFAASVQLQRYAADGSPVGGETQVNSYTTGRQIRPWVARSARGDFVVAWSSWGSFGSDGYPFSSQARQFDANANPRGPEFQVNTYRVGEQVSTNVATDADGNFIVAFQSVGSNGTDPDISVQARRYDQLFRDGFESADASRWSAISP